MPRLEPTFDPYRVLGVLRGATPAEINAAHRKLAKRYHPDGESGNEIRFLAVQEAYQLLADPARRAAWDRAHAPGPVRGTNGPRRHTGAAGPVDDDLDEPLTTATPTLLLSGTADPITPPAYATRAAAGLKRAWLLTGEHQGHGQIAVGCMPDVVAGFVAAAALEDGAAACIDDSFVMPFFLSFSGPAP